MIKVTFVNAQGSLTTYTAATLEQAEADVANLISLGFKAVVYNPAFGCPA